MRNVKKFFCMGVFVLCVVSFNAFAQESGLVIGTSGEVSFISDAPLEIIKAESTKLAGVINTNDRSFRFQIPMSSFQGFNSALQKTHFNENYIETAKFPNAVFEGKIIEDVDFSETGTINVRAKGTFSVHGVDQDRIIRSKMIIQKGEIQVSAEFRVPLEDHDIKIPSIVSQKIAEEIFVEISITLVEKK